jgi:hypothetical protein
MQGCGCAGNVEGQPDGVWGIKLEDFHLPQVNYLDMLDLILSST